jgi:hypothetical protein
MAAEINGGFLAATSEKELGSGAAALTAVQRRRRNSERIHMDGCTEGNASAHTVMQEVILIYEP